MIAFLAFIFESHNFFAIFKNNIQLHKNIAFIIHGIIGICKYKKIKHIFYMCFIAGNIAILKSMALQETFINNLKFYRKKAGLTQAQLALLIDKSFNYINGIECGVSFPPPDVIEKIAERLGVTPVQLFSESGCPINIVSFNKEKIVDEITQNLYARLRDEIHKEIEKVLER